MSFSTETQTDQLPFVKGKGFLYRATYTVGPEQRTLQSRKWQLIVKRQ